MVHLTKIYTRSGDRGTTGLGNGSRISKTHARVAAYGTVDEANAAIGLAVCEAEALPEVALVLRGVQNALFDVGADLCTPVGENEHDGDKLRVSESQTVGLEREIDRFNADLGALRSFVLPGGTRLAAALHLARTVVRRAERLTVGLAESEPDNVNGEAVRYLNRLSDLLFVLARWSNAKAGGDVLWVPGKNRAEG